MSRRAIFIPTYNRPNNIITYETLKKQNYNGDIYFIVGDDDPALEEYKKLYGNKVLSFSKDKVRPSIDMLDNFEKKKAVVYARNAMFDIADKLGLDSFLVLDDDYNHIGFRRIFGEELKGFKIKDINRVIDVCFDYLEQTPHLDCFAWCQMGDFILGARTFENIMGKRKIMNAFFFKTSHRIRFMGSINEDLNASVYEGQRGKVCLTVNDVAINQMATQQNSGGLTDIYLDLGTYVKSFYSVIVAPNCVKISTMGNNDLRLHHKVNWKLAVPKIIREEVKNG